MNSIYLTKLATLMAAPLTRADILLRHLHVVMPETLRVTNTFRSNPPPSKLFLFGYLFGRMHYIMQLLSIVLGYTMYHRLTHLKSYDIRDAYHTLVISHESTQSHLEQGFAIGYLQEHVMIHTNQVHDNYLDSYKKAYILRDYSHIKKIFFEPLIGNFSPPFNSPVKNVFHSKTLEWRQIHNELGVEFQKIAGHIF